MRNYRTFAHIYELPAMARQRSGKKGTRILKKKLYFYSVKMRDNKLNINYKN